MDVRFAGLLRTYKVERFWAVALVSSEDVRGLGPIFSAARDLCEDVGHCHGTARRHKALRFRFGTVGFRFQGC